MAREYDLVAVDIDGTLMDSADRLRPAVKEALLRVHEAGVPVVLCTGRRFRTTLAARTELGAAADVVVCSGGAAVKDVRTGRSLVCWPLEAALAGEVAGWMRRAGALPIVLPDEAADGRELLLSELDRARFEEGGRPYLEWHSDHVAFRPDALPEAGVPILEVYTVDREDRVEAADGMLPAALREQASVLKMRQGLYGRDQLALEFLARGVSKARALAWLLDAWGIDPRRVIAFGDDVNDIEMIRYAGAGVAMGNAVESVRRAAAFQTLDCDHDGVAVALRRLMPGLF